MKKLVLIIATTGLLAATASGPAKRIACMSGPVPPSRRRPYPCRSRGPASRPKPLFLGRTTTMHRRRCNYRRRPGHSALPRLSRPLVVIEGWLAAIAASHLAISSCRHVICRLVICRLVILLGHRPHAARAWARTRWTTADRR